MGNAKLKDKLIKGYKKMGEEDLKILEEWEQAKEKQLGSRVLKLLKKANLTEKDWQEIRIRRKEEFQNPKTANYKNNIINDTLKVTEWLKKEAKQLKAILKSHCSLWKSS